MESPLSHPPPEHDVSRWSLRGVAVAIAIGTGALATGALLGHVVVAPRGSRPHDTSAPSASSPAPPPPLAPDDVAFLAPIAPGQTVLNYTVREASPARGALAVRLARGADEVELSVTQRSGFTAPATFGPYEVLYRQSPAAERDGAALCAEVARKLRPHESWPAPPALR